jgi:Protein of unknown function (DUF2934)/Putative peptidoglycan binding domain
MPENRYSNGLDEQAIREFAHQLWEEKGRPQGRELEIWLEAEARLRVRNQIPYPIAFCDFSVYIPRTLETPTATQVVCPTPEPGYITVSSSRSAPVQGATVVPLETLAHDSRAVLVELITATVLLDRIARLAEWVAYQLFPGETFLESDPSTGALRLRLPYVRALLDPTTHEIMVGEIDRAISNIPYASFVAFDITGISLESPVTLRGVAKVFSLGTLGTLATLVIPVITFFGDIAKDTAPDVIKDVVKARIEFFQASQERQKEHQKDVERLLAADMTEMQNHADRVRVMQKALSNLGYNPGFPDGIFGPRTRAALEQFCQREHVPCDRPHGKAAISHLAYVAAAKIIPH